MVKKICFKKETFFYSAESIEKVFGISGIVFQEKTILKLIGEIGLSNNISFAGNISIKNGTKIEIGAVLENTKIGENNNIREYSILKNTEIKGGNIIGPFCFLRDKTFIGDECIVGNQVEVTRSKISKNVKISHQAFIGDASVGKNVIIGAGVIFCNHDGINRHKSIIENDVLLGSGSIIISPLTIEEKAVVAAGSIVTKKIDSGEIYLKKR